MRKSLIICSVAILVSFVAAGSALADPIPADQTDSHGMVTADLSPAIPSQAIVSHNSSDNFAVPRAADSQAFDGRAFSDVDPHYDHVLVTSSDMSGMSGMCDHDPPPPSAPEPASFLLLALGLTPLLWVRRKSDAV
jgi:hypothetical protein